jgi:hypothetical protein
MGLADTVEKVRGSGAEDIYPSSSNWIFASVLVLVEMQDFKPVIPFLRE